MTVFKMEGASSFSTVTLTERYSMDKHNRKWIKQYKQGCSLLKKELIYRYCAIMLFMMSPFIAPCL